MYLSITSLILNSPLTANTAFKGEINREVNCVIRLELCALVALLMANGSAAEFWQGLDVQLQRLQAPPHVQPLVGGVAGRGLPLQEAVHGHENWRNARVGWRSSTSGPSPASVPGVWSRSRLMLHKRETWGEELPVCFVG